MASLIASGITEVASADFTLAAGESATLSLCAPAGRDPSASIQLKGSDNSYAEIGKLGVSRQALVLAGAGVYRVVRKANDLAFGVDKT